MKIAMWLRGIAAVGLSEVNVVIAEAKAVVNAVPFLPANIKADVSKTLDDANADLQGLAGLAATLGGAIAADAVDDLTSLLAETAQKVATSGTDLSQLSVAEKTVLAQTWTAMRAQGDTLLAQFIAGINPLAQPSNQGELLLKTPPTPPPGAGEAPTIKVS